MVASKASFMLFLSGCTIVKWKKNIKKTENKMHRIIMMMISLHTIKSWTLEDNIMTYLSSGRKSSYSLMSIY